MTVYLDNAATSWPKPNCVTAAICDFIAKDAANPGRAGHRMAVAAERMLDDLRGAVADLIDAPDYKRLILCLNGTDALNIGIKGVLKDGDHVITTTLEHNSVSRPLQQMAEAGRIELTRVKNDQLGFINPDDIRAAITPKTKLIACTHASNAVGTIQHVEEIGYIAREADVIFLLDAAQTVGLIPVSVERFHVDLLAFPGHKSLLGPTGTGCLYVGERADPAPFREGGTGGDSSLPTQPHLYPYWLEGGTPNTVGCAGLLAAIQHLRECDPNATLKHERSLISQVREALFDNDRVKVYGCPQVELCVPTLSLNLSGFEASDVGTILDNEFDIAVRAGMHCAPYVHRELGTYPNGSIRVSPGPTSTHEELQEFLLAVDEVINT